MAAKIPREEGIKALREKLSAEGVLREPFTNSKGMKISSRQSLAKDPKALFFFFHGYDNHCSVAHLAEMLKDLADKGISGFAMDFTGHGLSEGLEGVVDYKQYIEDGLQFIGIVTSEFPGIPFFVSGESMGGGISILMGLKLSKKIPEEPESKDADAVKVIPKGTFLGEILFAPAIQNSVEPHPAVTWVLRNVLLPLTPLSRVPGLPVLTPEMCTKDKERQEEIRTDPLYDGQAFRLVSADSMLTMTTEIQANFKNIEYPFLVIHGTKDCIIPISGSEALYKESKTAPEDKVLQVIEGGFHDVGSEIRKLTPEEYEKMVKWMMSRL